MSVLGRRFLRTFGLLFFLFLVAGTPAQAASLTLHADQASFAAAAGPALAVESFDGFAAGTVLTTQVPGVVFSSPQGAYPGFVPVQALTSPGAVSPPQVLGGGYASGAPDVDQVIVLDLSPAVSGVAFFMAPQSPDALRATFSFDLSDGTSESVIVDNPGGTGGTASFFGATATAAIARLTITSTKLNTGQGGFGKLNLDDLSLGYGSGASPICAGTVAFVGGARVVEGTATDGAPGDSGIQSVALAPGAVNVTLEVDPLFEPGDPTVSFRVSATDAGLDGLGTIEVLDGEGNTCTLDATFRALQAGEVQDETVCLAPGLLMSATNEAGSPGGSVACSSTAPADAPLPPGYEFSPPVDPFPCTVMTVGSPISGTTGMLIDKQIVFEPDLRLLFSRHDGVSFEPFADVTDSVEEITEVLPDPTRVKGLGSWSLVRVACARLAEICNGLDDDGDGDADEGLPVGDLSVDADADGFPLCAPEGEPFDCSDQIASINPAASETCNGLDDDCDGTADDGDPGAGASCEIAGELGVCAQGVTACRQGGLRCKPSAAPAPESCNGLDDDCDGTADEVRVFGGYLQPVNADGTSVFKQGSTIPVKFQLSDCAGALVAGSTATLEVLFESSGVVGTVLEVVPAGLKPSVGTTFVYDAKTRQYHFNLGTKPLLPDSTYRLRTHLDDGSSHDVIVSIR